MPPQRERPCPAPLPSPYLPPLLLLLLLTLDPLPLASAGWCISNCSQPINSFCPVQVHPPLTAPNRSPAFKPQPQTHTSSPSQGDVCAFPSGDTEARLALEAMSFLNKGGNCEAAFKRFLCNLYFPQVTSALDPPPHPPSRHASPIHPVHIWLCGAAVLQVPNPLILNLPPP